MILQVYQWHSIAMNNNVISQLQLKAGLLHQFLSLGSGTVQTGSSILPSLVLPSLALQVPSDRTGQTKHFNYTVYFVMQFVAIL